jgi:hypothetical protein
VGRDIGNFFVWKQHRHGGGEGANSIRNSNFRNNVIRYQIGYIYYKIMDDIVTGAKREISFNSLKEIRERVWLMARDIFVYERSLYITDKINNILTCIKEFEKYSAPFINNRHYNLFAEGDAREAGRQLFIAIDHRSQINENGVMRLTTALGAVQPLAVDVAWRVPAGDGEAGGGGDGGADAPARVDERRGTPRKAAIEAAKVVAPGSAKSWTDSEINRGADTPFSSPGGSLHAAEDLADCAAAELVVEINKEHEELAQAVHAGYEKYMQAQQRNLRAGLGDKGAPVSWVDAWNHRPTDGCTSSSALKSKERRGTVGATTEAMGARGIWCTLQKRKDMVKISNLGDLYQKDGIWCPKKIIQIPNRLMSRTREVKVKGGRKTRRKRRKKRTRRRRKMRRKRKRTLRGRRRKRQRKKRRTRRKK